MTLSPIGLHGIDRPTNQSQDLIWQLPSKALHRPIIPTLGETVTSRRSTRTDPHLTPTQSYPTMFTIVILLMLLIFVLTDANAATYPNGFGSNFSITGMIDRFKLHVCILDLAGRHHHHHHHHVGCSCIYVDLLGAITKLGLANAITCTTDLPPFRFLRVVGES